MYYMQTPPTSSSRHVSPPIHRFTTFKSTIFFHFKKTHFLHHYHQSTKKHIKQRKKMADRQHQLQVHRQPDQTAVQKYGMAGLQQHQNGGGGSPSASKVIAVVTLLPLGGTLLFLAGLTLMGTVIGLMLATPVFIICSPVLVPATIAIGLAVTGFLGSGAMSLTGLSSLSWVFNFIRGVNVPDQMDHAKRRVQDAAGHVGQKTKEAGQAIQGKAQEGVEQKRT